MTELNTIITLRQGTTAEWAISSVILKKGETGLEYLADGSVKIKAGDGEHLWQDLPYIESDITTENFYTKEEIGLIEENKTLVQMIAEAQEAATYDDTLIKTLISNEEARAKEVEEKIDNRLVGIETFFATVESPDEVIDTLAEIVDYINKDKTGMSSMLQSIQANANAITAINNPDTGILAIAELYTDGKINEAFNNRVASGEQLGLIKIDNNTIKINESKQIYIDKMSTDNIVQGSQTLILKGGSATE